MTIPFPQHPRPNLKAARATVRALRRDGRLTDFDRSRVTAFLSLAEAVDVRPDNANLWRQYREAEAVLRAERHDSGPDDLAGLHDELQTAMEHSAADEPGNLGATGGGDLGEDGAAADAVAAPGG